VVIAAHLDNSPGETDLGALIAEAAQSLGAAAIEAGPARIAVWNEAYLKLGVDPGKFTPSIKFLYDQIRKGKPPRSISKIVDAMNLVSLRHMAPCGGDDLRTILPGDLRLGFAQGDETFAPLFKPAAFDNPSQSNKVMCRRWTWRNADFSKITPDTKEIAVNIDIMTPPFAEADVNDITKEMAALLEKYCSASTTCYQLHPGSPGFEFSN
jgi:lysyl-tRNA synthetase class 2